MGELMAAVVGSVMVVASCLIYRWPHLLQEFLSLGRAKPPAVARKSVVMLWATCALFMGVILIGFAIASFATTAS